MATTATETWTDVFGPSTPDEVREGIDAGVNELVEQLADDAARPTKPGKADPHAANPSKTTTIQRKYAQKLRGRFSTIAMEVRAGVRDRDVLGLDGDDGERTSVSDILAGDVVPDEVRDRLVELLAAERYGAVDELVEQLADDFDPDDLSGQDFDFTTLSWKHSEFMDWLRTQQEAGILEVIGRDENPYVRSAYERGWKNAGQWMDEDPVEADIASALQRPVHRDKLELLYSRNFEALQGITEDVSRQISRELANGLAEGVHPEEMASRITDRIDSIGKTRATTLARTESMYAHNEATISTYEDTLGDIETEVVSEVSTAGDAHVCEICTPLEGKTYSLEDARKEGPPFHPRCRCILVPKTSRSDSAPAPTATAS